MAKLPWNVARMGTNKARALFVLAWLCTPSQYIKWRFCSLESARVGNDYNYVKFSFLNPFRK